MFITLLIIACVAALVAGVILLAFRVVGRRPPRFLIPASIGVAILAFVTHSRYTWADLMVSRLPETVAVISTYRGGTLFEPWTALWPRITHFSAIDQATLAAHARLPGVYLIEMILVGEGDPTLTVPLVVDCIQGRHATLGTNTPLDPTMLTDTLDWRTGRNPDRLFEIVCGD